MAEITRVVDDDGTDASDKYVLSAALILGRVEVRSEEKAIRLDTELYPHVGALLDRFSELNLETGDASALNFEYPDALRIVDFTTKVGARLLASYWWDHTPAAGG